MIPLHCKAQTYHWGRKGLSSIVGQSYFKDSKLEVLQQQLTIYIQGAEKELALKDYYAELWIGDHPNGPSEITLNQEDHQLEHIIQNETFFKNNVSTSHQASRVPLSQLFKLNPQRFMGKQYLDKFGCENEHQKDVQDVSMPFLFKVLAVEKALSIQAHPHKELAQKLHAEFPEVYKDPNHKPEIAIALNDNFLACYGFSEAEALRKNFAENKVLAKLFISNEHQDLPIEIFNEDLLKKSVHKMFYELDHNLEQLEAVVNELLEDISKLSEGERSEHQSLFITLVDQYGKRDIGVIFSFFFNILRLNKGEAIVITPDEPHAYINGNIIECMVSSDNVVRGGLTPKFKDTDTLVKMMPYELRKREPQHGQIIQQDDHSQLTEYKTGYSEFRVFKLLIKASGASLNSIQLPQFKSFSMAIVIEGSGEVESEEFGSFCIDELRAYYIMPDIKVRVINTSVANKSRRVESITNERTQPKQDNGHAFIIDPQTLTKKILKILQVQEDNEADKSVAQLFMDTCSNISLELCLYPTEFLKENSLQRIILIQQGGKKILEILLGTHNRISISSQNNKQMVKKSHFELDMYNSLLIKFDMQQKSVQVFVNNILRCQLDLNIMLADIIKAQFIIGGHSQSFLNPDQMKTKNLFHGLIKNFKMILNHNEQASSEKHIHNPPAIIENSEEFVVFHSLYEVAQFNPKQYIYHEPTVPLAKRIVRDRKILICHDIAGGLIEEKYTQGLYPDQKFNHWSSIDIFIYFGHYTLTVPPPSYINVAHSHGVKMLGTLIFEWEQGAKGAALMLQGKIAFNVDLSKMFGEGVKDAPDGNKFYARKLAEIAKYFGFDGYLMNFECDMEEEQVEELLKWLDILREELHNEIPGSLLIWYDSVLHNGDLKWQSALNEKNYRFFGVSDAFFTDYHWEPERLQTTLTTFNEHVASNKRLSSFDIYYGNDTYGRGTYGGGQENIYIAIDEIIKFPFSIALFGQAFWYEGRDGKLEKSIFQMNEDVFWKGRNLKLIADCCGRKHVDSLNLVKKLMGEWNITDGPKDWKIVKDSESDYSTISSAHMCIKKLEISIAELIVAQVLADRSELQNIIFVSKVRGIGPDFKDYFNASIQILDANGQELFSKKFVENQEFSNCKDLGEYTPIKFMINMTDQLKQNIEKIIIIEQGKDVEYWGGHFGSEFSGERLYFEIQGTSEESQQLALKKNLLSIFKQNTICFDYISTSFSNGMGSSYYIDGALVSNGFYSNFNEYDIIFSSLVNGAATSKKGGYFNFEVTNDGPHFNGGSSFNIKGKLSEQDEISIPMGGDLMFQLPKNVSSIKDVSFELKVIFKMDYQPFKGNISLVFISEQEGLIEETECYEVFTPEIKRNQLIYVKNTWAIFEGRMIDFSKPFNKILLRISSPTESDIDLRIGLLTLVPSSLCVSHNQLSIKMDNLNEGQNKGITIVHQKLESVGKNEDQSIYDIHLNWRLEPEHLKILVKQYRIFRNDKFIGNVLIPRYNDQYVQHEKNGITYKIQAISLRFDVVYELEETILK